MFPFPNESDLKELIQLAKREDMQDDDVTSRLQLKNRSHAVAYALREGLI